MSPTTLGSARGPRRSEPAEPHPAGRAARCDCSEDPRVPHVSRAGQGTPWLPASYVPGIRGGLTSLGASRRVERLSSSFAASILRRSSAFISTSALGRV